MISIFQPDTETRLVTVLPRKLELRKYRSTSFEKCVLVKPLQPEWTACIFEVNRVMAHSFEIKEISCLLRLEANRSGLGRQVRSQLPCLREIECPEASEMVKLALRRQSEPGKSIVLCEVWIISININDLHFAETQ